MKYYAPTKLSDNIRETPEGFLLCLGVPIARTGWQVYGKDETPLQPGADGKVNVYRDPKDVFHPDTMASFEGKALTIGHPEATNFLTPMNWKDLAKGLMQNIRKAPDKDEDGEHSLLADVLVTDVQAIQLITAGLREVSCGYEAVYEQTGDGKGRQTQIVGNHLALVQAGRAGSGYAIRDHKNKEEELRGMSKLAEKVKAFFIKTIDEAAADAESEKSKDMAKDEDEKKDDKKDKAKDDEGKVEKKADGSVSYDELVKMVKDMSEKLAGVVKAKDEPDPSKEKKEDESKDAEGSEQPSVEDRLSKLEAMLSKLMEGESVGDEDKDKKDKKEEVGDDDDDGDDSSMVGDAASAEDEDVASRAEILSPGIDFTKDVKVKSLKAAYATKDGKLIIDSLTGGKAPAFDSAEHVSNLFIAASEVMKAKRGTGLGGTKNSKSFDSGMKSNSDDMTAERMNEINQKFYANR